MAYHATVGLREANSATLCSSICHPLHTVIVMEMIVLIVMRGWGKREELDFLQSVCVSSAALITSKIVTLDFQLISACMFSDVEKD